MDAILDVEDVLYRRTLIVGDVGSGKTRLTARVLEKLVEKGFSDKITVIDMAPSARNVGARLSAYTRAVEKVRYLFSENIRGPRLEGRDCREVLTIAESNRRIAEEYFEAFLQHPTEILIVNDITIYLHAGEVEKVFEVMEAARTFLANAYYGRTLSEDKGSGLSVREALLVKTLSGKCDRVVVL